MTGRRRDVNAERGKQGFQRSTRGAQAPSPSTVEATADPRASVPGASEGDYSASYARFATWKDLNPEATLYHGTDCEIEDGRVHPTVQYDNAYEGQSVAFATTDLEEARQYGAYVYEVEADRDTEEGWANTVYSETGYRVIGPVLEG